MKKVPKQPESLRTKAQKPFSATMASLETIGDGEGKALSSKSMKTKKVVV